MFGSYAPHRRVPSRRGQRGALRGPAWLLLALALLPLAFAQSAPTVTLGSYNYAIGDTLDLRATNLEGGASYRVELTPPPQDQQPSTPLVATLTASASGTLRYTAPLTASGAYQVRVVGPRLDAALNVQVSGAPARQPQPGARPPAPQEPTPAPAPAPEPALPAEPAPLTPPVGATPAPAGTQFSLDGDSVVARSASGAQLWQLTFPNGSGDTAGLVEMAGRLLVGHGNHLLELEPSSGKVLARHRLPAQVVDAAFSGAAVQVTVRYASGEQRQVRVERSGVAQPLPFDPDPSLYGWLRAEANVADQAARLEQDPTNPWLYVAAASRLPASSPAAQADGLLRQALANAATFYERAQLADSFLRQATPRTDLAGAAMDAAMRDFAARGYRTELLTSDQLDAAYGFPRSQLLSALGRGDLQRADFWADWLYRTAAPGAPGRQAALAEYAHALQAAGQRDDASLWRSRANEGGGFQIGATLTQAAKSVGRTGWYGVAALIVSILALHITLLAKYWRPQSLTLRRLREAGRRTSPFAARLTFMRYATLTEKFVTVLLFAAALALTALQGWAGQIDEAPIVFGSGSLATPTALDAAAHLTGDSHDALFVSGYAAQTAGDAAAARAAYLQLPDDPGALNNLAVLEDDPALFDRALELAPSNEVVLANLGRAANPSPLLAAYAADQPALVAPSAERLAAARAGTYLGAWAAAFTNPWAALTNVHGVTWPGWLWTVVVVLFLLWAALTVIALFIPRPRLARNAPRNLLYHLLALLLPGTGLADEFWGILLMVPWAIFGVDFLLHYLPGALQPSMSFLTDGVALIAIYVINLVAFVIELGSYRRRMTALKQNDPHTAREYGMRVAAPDLS